MICTTRQSALIIAHDKKAIKQLYV